MVKFIAALIAIAGFAPPLPFGGPSQPDEVGELQAIQERFLADRGIDLETLAAQMQVHLGLPEAPIGGIPGRCDLALLEHSEADAHVVPADPETALAGVVADLRSTGPTDVQTTLAYMAARDVDIEWDPEELDGTNYLAIQTSKRLMVGAQWLSHALDDPASVHGNIQHEVGGHLYYGDTLSCRIVDAAVGDNDSVDHMDLFWKYGYAESEIYAELKELPHAIEGALGDDPLVDVADQVAHMRAVFPTEVAELLLDSMAHRFVADTTLTPHAIELFEATIA